MYYQAFTYWKKAVENRRVHVVSALHIQDSQIAVEAQQSLCQGSIGQQLQEVMIQERMNSRAAIKFIIHCTHFLAWQHIPLLPVLITWLTWLYLGMVNI